MQPVCSAGSAALRRTAKRRARPRRRFSGAIPSGRQRRGILWSEGLCLTILRRSRTASGIGRVSQRLRKHNQEARRGRRASTGCLTAAIGQSYPSRGYDARASGCRGRIRTDDLRVMSATSYRAAPPYVMCCGLSGVPPARPSFRLLFSGHRSPRRIARMGQGYKRKVLCQRLDIILVSD